MTEKKLTQKEWCGKCPIFKKEILGLRMGCCFTRDPNKKSTCPRYYRKYRVGNRWITNGCCYQQNP